jgi:hypothetical protein
MGKADEFKHPRMFTLTVKPDHFDNDPQKAFLWVTQKKFIARLMTKLGVKRWVWTLEFHKSGFPHWHLLIDAPGGFLDLNRAWAFWGWQSGKWKLGGLNLGNQQLKDGRHAVRYITKYLVKYPEEGFPDWVLDLDQRIRWVQGSRAVGRLVSDRERTEKDAEKQENAEEAVQSVPAGHRTLRNRRLTCGDSVDFFRECLDQATGQTVLQFAGRLPEAIFNLAVTRGLVSPTFEQSGPPHIRDSGQLLNDFSRWVGIAHSTGYTGQRLVSLPNPFQNKKL